MSSSNRSNRQLKKAQPAKGKKEKPAATSVVNAETSSETFEANMLKRERRTLASEAFCFVRMGAIEADPNNRTVQNEHVQSLLERFKVSSGPAKREHYITARSHDEKTTASFRVYLEESKKAHAAAVEAKKTKSGFFLVITPELIEKHGWRFIILDGHHRWVAFAEWIKRNPLQDPRWNVRIFDDRKSFVLTSSDTC